MHSWKSLEFSRFTLYVKPNYRDSNLETCQAFFNILTFSLEEKGELENHNEVFFSRHLKYLFPQFKYNLESHLWRSLKYLNFKI